MLALEVPQTAAENAVETNASQRLPSVLRSLPAEGAAAEFKLVSRVDTVAPQSKGLRGTKVISAPMIRMPTPVEAIAEWHGRVIEILETFFVAELKGLIGDGVRGALDEAEIPLAEVQPGDRELCLAGAFFRLCIEYRTIEGRGRVRCSYLAFRRLPAYNLNELQKAERDGQWLARNLRVE